MITKKEISLILDWYKYVIMNEDVPIHEDNIILADKLMRMLRSPKTGDRR